MISAHDVRQSLTGCSGGGGGGVNGARTNTPDSARHVQLSQLVRSSDQQQQQLRNGGFSSDQKDQDSVFRFDLRFPKDQFTARKILNNNRGTRGNTPTSLGGGVPRSPGGGGGGLLSSSKHNSASMHLDDLAHADSSSTLNSLHATSGGGNAKLSSSSYGGRTETERQSSPLLHPLQQLKHHGGSSTNFKPVPISMPESSRVGVEDDQASDLDLDQDFDLEHDDLLRGSSSSNAAATTAANAFDVDNSLDLERMPESACAENIPLVKTTKPSTGNGGGGGGAAAVNFTFDLSKLN